MGRGTQLDSKELAVVQTFHTEGMSQREIAECLNRSNIAISDVFNGFWLLQVWKSRCDTKNLEARPTSCHAKDSYWWGFGTKLRQHPEMLVSVRRTQQILSETEYCVYERYCKAPKFTFQHRSDRLSSALVMLDRDTRYWSSIVLSEETHFVLDGPDGWR